MSHERQEWNELPTDFCLRWYKNCGSSRAEGREPYTGAFYRKETYTTTLTTTLRLLRQHNACQEQNTVLRKALGEGYGDTTAISLARIVQTNGLDDALGSLQATIEDYTTVVRPFLRQYMADVLEHTLRARLGKESKSLLAEGVTLLRDPATTNVQLSAYADKARAAAVSARAARATRAAEAAVWAAEATEVTETAGAAWAAWVALVTELVGVTETAIERDWQMLRFIDRLEGRLA